MKSSIIILLFFLAGFSFPASANSQETIDMVMQANNHYVNNRYDEAAKIYEELLSQDNHNAYVYYNLGNTYVRQNELGKAILNYLKARQLLPRDKDLDAKFIEEASKRGLKTLKGHRTVGGMRASIYNAMPKEGIETLVEFMTEFEKDNKK